MKHEFHNPDNLTAEQGGEGYRLLLESEVHCDRSQPTPELKWKKEREAFARGEAVEAQLASDWAPDTWIPLDANYEGDWDTLFAVRIKSDVSQRELNEAHAAGKLIQWKFKDSETWWNKTKDFDEYQADYDYRVKSEKPWTLDNTSVNGFILAEGQEWRKTREPWKWDELPPTFRPFTTLDVITAGDQFQFHGKTEWLTIAEGDSDVGEKPKTSHKFRTRRPLSTPEIPWTEWHGGECPLNDEEVEEWELKFRDGDTLLSNVRPSRSIRWRHCDIDGDVVAYRVLKRKIKTPALAKDTNSDTLALISQHKEIQAQLQSIIAACQLRGYIDGGSLNGWLKRYFKGSEANLNSLLHAKARLAQLEWRPVSVIPTKEDANSFGYLEATDGIHTCHFKYQNYPIASSWTHWRPAALPESPDPIVAEFTKWWEDQMDDPLPVGSATALRIWKAAKKANKGQAK